MAETHCRMSSAFADLSLWQSVRKHVLFVYAQTPVGGHDTLPPHTLSASLVSAAPAMPALWRTLPAPERRMFFSFASWFIEFPLHWVWQSELNRKDNITLYCFTAALQLLYCCFTAALLLLYNLKWIETTTQRLRLRFNIPECELS